MSDKLEERSGGERVRTTEFKKKGQTSRSLIVFRCATALHSIGAYPKIQTIFHIDNKKDKKKFFKKNCKKVWWLEKDAVSLE